jgi:hypothetical protein
MIPLVVLALLVFSLLTCLFALIKGGQAERIGSAVILSNLLASTASELLLRNQVISLSIDGLTALVLLMVAVRYASVWLGVVMLLYAIQFGLHASYFVLERPRDNLHIVVNNVDFFAVSVCLAVGTVLSWRQRLRVAQGSLQPAP